MSIVRRPRSTLATVLLLAPFAFLGGMVADRAVVFAARDGSTYRQLDVFTRVLSYIQNNYVEKVDDERLIAGAIKGMVGTLDPHTVYMPPELFRDMKVDTEGEFGGLGIELTTRSMIHRGVRGEFLAVVSALDDTPASRAGLKPGDVILAIDGALTSELELAGAVSKMRGAPGSRVTLTLLREGFSEPLDLVLVRDHIRIVSVEGRLHDGYGHVRIKTFQEQTDRNLKKVLNDLRLQNKGELKGLILDLRNNPGGLLDQAVLVSDRFLPGGLTIVTTKGRGGNHLEEEKSHDRDTEPAYPMIVLINAGSASASEIVAGALQDHGRAVLMGTQSFGKGSVQTLIELDDGSGLKLTIARYFTPSGRSIQERGITPDVVVHDPATAAREALLLREADLKNHLSNDAGGQGESASRAPEARPAPAGGAPPQTGEDHLLKTALDYLRTWQIFKGHQLPAKAALAK